MTRYVLRWTGYASVADKEAGRSGSHSRHFYARQAYEYHVSFLRAADLIVGDYTVHEEREA